MTPLFELCGHLFRTPTYKENTKCLPEQRSKTQQTHTRTPKYTSALFWLPWVAAVVVIIVISCWFLCLIVLLLFWLFWFHLCYFIRFSSSPSWFLLLFWELGGRINDESINLTSFLLRDRRQLAVMLPYCRSYQQCLPTTPPLSTTFAIKLWKQ